MKAPPLTAPPLAIDLITLLALAFIFGIGLSICIGGQDFGLNAINSWWPLAGAALLLPLAFFIRNGRWSRIFLPTLAIVLFFTLGLYLGIVSSRPAKNDILAHLPDNEEVILFGYVAAMPSHTARGSRAEFDVVAVQRWQETEPRPAAGRVLARLPAPWPGNCPPGTFAVIRAKLEAPRAATVPGGFDYARYLAQKGIWKIAAPRGPTLIVPALDTSAAWWPKIHYWPDLLRYRAGLFLDHHLSPASAALYRAILIGDGSCLSEASVEAFIASGSMHIMVISGSHIALLSLMCFATLYWFFRRFPALILAIDVKKLAWLGCLPLLALYSLLAGGDSPVMRSLVMCAIAAAALFFHRAHAWPPLIALAALLLLLVNPQSLFAASFQLSFVAVLALVAAASLFAPQGAPSRESGWRQRAVQWLKAAFIAVTAAAIGTMPLTIAIFHRLPIFGPLATLTIEPVLSFWSVPLGFVALLLMAVLPSAATWLLHIGELGLIIADKLAFFFAALPFASLRLPPPPVSLFVLYYTGLILFLLAFHRQKSLAALGLLLTVASAIVFCSPIASRLQPDFADTPKITVLDVGQGSATVIHTAPGQALVIDGGGQASGPRSVGISVIAPYLWRHGVRKIEIVAVTHADSDHCNGVAFLLEQFAVDAIWINDPVASGESFQNLLATARRRGVAVHQAQAGDQWRQEQRQGVMTLSCLANLAEEVEDSRNAGLVLRFQDENFSMLFPGDIDAEMEARLLASGVSVKSNVLMAVHHGSRGSNSPALLAAVAPHLIVVSASASRAGMFPATELLARCQENHLPLVTTGQLGSVFLRWRGGFSYSGWLHNGEAHGDKPPLSAAGELGSLPALSPLPAN